MKKLQIEIRDKVLIGLFLAATAWVGNQLITIEKLEERILNNQQSIQALIDLHLQK